MGFIIEDIEDTEVGLRPMADAIADAMTRISENFKGTLETTDLDLPNSGNVALTHGR